MEIGRVIATAEGTRSHDRSIDRWIAEIAARQHGRVARRASQDLTRDRALAAAGYRPLRAGWIDVLPGRRPLVGQLRRILGLTPRQ